MNQDEEHLKLLSIFHYIAGGLAGLFACIPIFHLIIGIVMLVAGLTETSSDEKFIVFLVGFMFTLYQALSYCVVGRWQYV